QVSHMAWTDGNIYDDGGSTVRNNDGAPVKSLTAPFVYEVSNASKAWTSRLYGTQQFTTATNTVGLRTAPQIGGNSSGFFFDGYWCEMCLFNRVLSAQDRTSLVGYFSSLYRITAT